MSTPEMRKKIKKYIDEADEHVVKMVYSMLEADRDHDWWDGLPKKVRDDIDKTLMELDNGKGIPHEEVVKKYKKWFAK